MKKIYCTALVLLTFSLSWAQSQPSQNTQVSGKITDEKSGPLAYATVYIRELGTGTVANDVGFYTLNLPAGSYHLVFQSLGYESVEKEVHVNTDPILLDIVLPGQTIMLKNIVVSDKNEDPAYAIMRKAIAKAEYHLNQVDTSSAMIYLKGKGRVLSVPFFIRGAMKKEGIDSTKLFLSESYSIVQYRRPNIVKEKVISVRTSGPESKTDPMEFINGNIYDTRTGNVISPLSPKAFAWYRFKYMGSFKEGDYEISKIKVIPRVRNEETFEGTISFVEDYFCVHSLDLNITIKGINVNFEQIYKPIVDNVWLPVTHKIFVEGKIFGVAFEYTYLASVSDYYVEVNPDLPKELVLIDEKSEILDDKTKRQATAMSKLQEGEELTTEELKAVLKSYEKQERADQKEPQIFLNKTFQIDSMAYKKDSSYWIQKRPIPLNNDEIKGYIWMDSLAEVHAREEKGDTLTRKDRSGFSPGHLIMGARYKIGEKAHFSIENMKTQFNTVEGWYLESGLSVTKTFENKQWLKIYPRARYGFSGKQLYATMGLDYGFGPRMQRTDLHFLGGRYIYQINSGNPISPFVNTLYSVFAERNYIKLYEKQFVKAQISKDLSSVFRINAGAEWSKRKELFNTTSCTLIDVKNRDFSPNAPENIEIGNASFPEHEAMIVTGSIRYTPGKTFGLRNDNLFQINRTPEFELSYTGGLKSVGGEADFHHVSVSGVTRVELGRNNLDVRLETGGFVSSKPQYLMDFHHFNGNQTIFAPGADLGKYRMLDYYTYSTRDSYLSGFLQYNPSKLLFTHFDGIRKSGIRESLYVNYLNTSQAGNYFETGIAFDNVLKVFKLEAVTSFMNGKYQNFGVRVGFSSLFRVTNNSLSVNL